MIWLVLAAQMSAPHPSNPDWPSTNDVPSKMVTPNVEQVVRIAITVKPDGKLQGCRVEANSGSSELGAYTCRVAMRRSRLRAAKDGNGNPIYGVYRTTIAWWVGDGYPPPSVKSGDFDLTVSVLPPKVKSPALVRLMFAVDQAGRPSDCRAEDAKYDPTLVKLGCEKLTESYTALPAITADGIPVPSIQNGTVLFRTD